jgi:hypothetical protein
MKLKKYFAFQIVKTLKNYTDKEYNIIIM